MSWKPETKVWPGKRAVLFVHGIGDCKPGHYDKLVQNFKETIGDQAATYFLYYDDLNDQFADKFQLANGISQIKNWIKKEAAKESADKLSEKIADFVGDVIFPVLSKDARLNIRERYIAQLQQIRLDGKASDVAFYKQEITIICHSMGCFHTYEAIHAAAKNEQYHLTPVTDNMQFANIIFMASPVQLIRSAASVLGDIIPKSELAVLKGAKLSIPNQETATGRKVFSTDNWISITGKLDPVGGFLFKKRLDWAYMEIADQKSIVDEQSLLNIKDKDELAQALSSDTDSSSKPVNNPHSWYAYMDGHKEGLKKWLNV